MSIQERDIFIGCFSQQHINWTTWRTWNRAASPNETWILNCQMPNPDSSLSRRVCRRLSSGGESMIFQKNTLWFVSSDVIIHGELRKSDLLRFGAFAAVAQSSVTATFGEERMTPRRSRRRRGLSRRMRRRVGAETLHEDDVPNHCLRLGIISLRMMGITHLSDGGEGIGDYVPSWW